MNYYSQTRDKTKQLSNSFLLKQKKKKQKKNHYLYLKIKYKYICWGLKNHDTSPKEMAHWANPMESKIKKVELTKEKDGRSKRFEAQNP